VIAYRKATCLIIASRRGPAAGAAATPGRSASSRGRRRPVEPSARRSYLPGLYWVRSSRGFVTVRAAGVDPPRMRPNQTITASNGRGVGTDHPASRLPLRAISHGQPCPVSRRATAERACSEPGFRGMEDGTHIDLRTGCRCRTAVCWPVRRGSPRPEEWQLTVVDADQIKAPEPIPVRACVERSERVRRRVKGVLGGGQCRALCRATGALRSSERTVGCWRAHPTTSSCTRYASGDHSRGRDANKRLGRSAGADPAK